MSKALLLALAAALLTLPARADIPCPITLLDGTLTHNTVHLDFRIFGKLPVQQLQFSCTPLGHPKGRVPSCHTETGLFYPGTPYETQFDYAAPPTGTVLLSLRTARLTSGALWTPSRHETCHSLKVTRKRSR